MKGFRCRGADCVKQFSSPHWLYGHIRDECGLDTCAGRATPALASGVTIGRPLARPHRSPHSGPSLPVRTRLRSTRPAEEEAQIQASEWELREREGKDEEKRRRDKEMGLEVEQRLEFFSVFISRLSTTVGNEVSGGMGDAFFCDFLHHFICSLLHLSLVRLTPLPDRPGRRAGGATAGRVRIAKRRKERKEEEEKKRLL
jgi:hypothetical protein